MEDEKRERPCLQVRLAQKPLRLTQIGEPMKQALIVILALMLLLAGNQGVRAQGCAIVPTGLIAERWLFLDGATGPLGCPIGVATQIEHQKDLPGETTSDRPAIAEHQGRLFLAWKGSGNSALNLMVSNDNGASFAGKVTFAETSDAAPAVISHNGSLFLAWRGSGNNNITVAKVSLFADTNGILGIEGLGPKVVLAEHTDLSPALASHGGRLFLAFKGSGNDQVNIIGSADDGTTFPVKRVLDETSDQAPSMVSDGTRLVLTWKGSGNENISVAAVSILGNTAGNFGIEGLRDKVVLGETTDERPVIGAHEGRLFLGWKGAGNKALNLMFANPGSMTFQGKQVLSDTSNNGPSLTSAGGLLWMAWRGVDNDRLNVGKALLFGNTAGGFGIERIAGGDALKMQFQNGEIVWSPTQGAKMVVAAYTDHDNLILNWGDTDPWNYDRFLVTTARNGQALPQAEIQGFIERTFGFYWMRQPLPARYVFSVEGCTVGAVSGHDCPQGWSIPVEVDYKLPTLPDYGPGVCAGAPVPAGFIGQRWAELGGPEGSLGCALAPEHPVQGARGVAQPFQHGEIVFSPDQGEQMLLAVYQQGHDLVADWGRTDPFLYETFQVSVDKNGTPFKTDSVQSATQGTWSLPITDAAAYRVSVEGCTGLLSCLQGFTPPATANVVFPPAPPSTDRGCSIMPVGLIGNRWASLGGKGGKLGCPTGAEQTIPGRQGRSQAFDNGQVVWSPEQGPQMVVSAYQESDTIIVDWGDTAQTSESFVVDVAYAGQSVGQHEVVVNATGGTFKVDYTRPEDDASVPSVGNGTGQYTLRVEECGNKGGCKGRNWTASASVSFRTAASAGPDLSDLPVVTDVATALQFKTERALRAARAIFLPATINGRWGDGEVDAAMAMLYLIEDELAHGNTATAFRRPKARFDMLTEINEAIRTQFAYGTGSLVNQLGCHRDGEYDFALKGYLPLIYRWGHVLAPDVRYRILHLLSKRGAHDPDEDSYQCVVTLPETENHLWLINSSRYLANQLWAKRSSDPIYDNRRNGLTNYLIGKLRGELKSDFIEYNSSPYSRFTWMAIQNLYDYAEDPQMKTAAQSVLDYLSLKAAISTSDGRRNPPFRRRVSNGHADFFNPQADPIKKRLLVYTAPTPVMKDLKPPNWVEDFAGGLVQAAATTYQPPNLILDLLVNPAHRSFVQRFDYTTTEIYAGKSDFLISAGGTRSDFAYTSSPGEAPVLGGAITGVLGFILAGPAGEVIGASGGSVVVALAKIHGAAEDMGYVQPTYLMPTGQFTTIKDMIRFDGMPSEVGNSSACVTSGFACGGSPVIPARYTSKPACSIVSGNWTFVDFSSSACRDPGHGDFGFFAAVHGAGKAFGMLEAVPKSKLNGASLRKFADTILARNQGRDFTTAGSYSYTGWGGNDVRFTLGKTTSVQSSGIAAIDAVLPGTSAGLASGTIANSDGRGVAAMTIVNAFTGDRLRLDLSNPANPIRVLTEADLISRLLSVGVDFSVPEADIRDWVVNPFTPYPAYSAALLDLLKDTGLRKPVFIDVISWKYEHEPGGAAPKSAADVDSERLRVAILQAYDERYDEHANEFQQILR